MELSDPTTTRIMSELEQHQPDHQSDELGFQDDQHTITDQLHAFSVQPREEEGDCNGSTDGDYCEEDEVEIKSDDDDGVSASVENEDVIGNGDRCRHANGEGRDVELIAGVGEMVNGGKTSRPIQFPVRPGAEDCTFYLRTSSCKFGMNCKFNHPSKRKRLSVRVKERARDESSEKAAKINCKYFDQPGGCKYGKACKYSHNKHFEPNFLGLPIRPGEKKCPYYMHNGSCKYGSSCRFNHPDPAASERSDALSVYRNGGPVASQGGPQSPLAPWSPPAPMNDTASYVPLLYPPTQGIPSSPEWNGYGAPFYRCESNMPISPASTVNSPLLEANIYAQRQQMPIDEFPERPGQPLCSYYVRMGDCKYKSACKFHHPMNRVSKSPSYALSNLGLPLRPSFARSF